MEGIRCKVKIKKVVWEYPEEDWVKYNTDGAARGNPGENSYAFCLRDANADLVYAEGERIEDITCTEAETRAILKAIKHCQLAGINRAIIQTDSLLLKQVLTGKWECPWNIAVEVDQIMEMMKAKNIHIQHIMREGNKLADHIANLALDTGGCKYHHFREMDSKGRKIINADKSKFYHIKVSLTKG
ncbi:hypothetical protein KY284_008070 [Solanum tuberosum]|nr:hypothetical protein KY284_008070 [Solanum tuberosum]